MSAIDIKTLEQLYEEDYTLWLDKTVNFLKSEDLSQLDIIHLIEEIEFLGNEQRRKVESYLQQLLKHLLRYQYWSLRRTSYESEQVPTPCPPECRNHWAVEIENFRAEFISSTTLTDHRG